MSTYQLGTLRSVLVGMVLVATLCVGAATLLTPAGIAHACWDYCDYGDSGGDYGYYESYYDYSDYYYDDYSMDGCWDYCGDYYYDDYSSGGCDYYGCSGGDYYYDDYYYDDYSYDDYYYDDYYYDDYDYDYADGYCDYSYFDDCYGYDYDEYQGYCDDYYFDDCYGYDDYDFYSTSGGSYTIGSGGARYSSSVGSSYSFATPSYTPSYSYPSYSVPNYYSAPTPVTNIDNSINDSFNDYSTNIIGSFNNNAGSFNNDSAVAIGASTWGSVTPIASVSPGYTIAAVTPSYTYTQPSYVAPTPTYPTNQRYVSLSQIPYTGFDYGPVGNAMYWMSLISLALAGGYFLVYYKGGVLAFAGSMIPRLSTPLKVNRQAREEIELPSIPFAVTTAPAADREEKEVGSMTKDTMSFSEKGIVINRNF